MPNAPSSVVTRSSPPDFGGDWVVAAARVRASIGHPHLIRMRYQASARSRLAVELCSAPTLAQVLEDAPLPPRDAVAVIQAVASAVEALAAHGLAPRELAPESIYLHRTRGAILSDSGVPASLESRAEVLSASARLYLSPEELAGDPFTARSLVYSLGAILADSVPLESPALLVRVVDRATAEHPNARYKTPRGFAAAAAASVLGLNRAGSTPSRPQRARREPPPAAPPAAESPALAIPPQEERPASDGGAAKTAIGAAAARLANGAKALKAARPAKPAKAAKPPKPAKPATAAKPEKPPRRPKAAKPPKPAKPARPPKAAKPPKPAKLAGPPKAAKPPKPPKTAQPPRPAKLSRAVKAVRSTTQAGTAKAAKAVRSTTQAAAAKAAKAANAAARGFARTRVAANAAARALARARETSALGLTRRTATRAAVVGFALVVAAGGAAVATRSGGDGPDPVLASGSLKLDLPSDWAPSRVSDVNGVALVGAGAAAPSDHEAAAGLVVGLARDSTEVQQLLRDARLDAAGRRQVKLGQLEAWRWTNVRLGDREVATLFVAFTSRGPLLATCDRSAAAALLAQCARAVRTLHLTGPRPVAVAAVERIQDDLETALLTLRQDRLQGRAALAAAPIAQTQAKAARSLESGFRSASQAVVGIPTPTGTADLAPLVAGLNGTASAYRGLAAAILSGDPATFDEARQKIIEEEARLDDEITAATTPWAG